MSNGIKEDLNFTISLKPSSFSTEAESTYYEVNPRKREKKEFTTDQIQAGLSATGFVPGPIGMGADALNALIDLSEGDLYGALANAVSIIPGAGDAAGISMKGARRSVNTLREGGSYMKLGDQLTDVDSIIADYNDPYPFLPNQYRPSWDSSQEFIEGRLTEKGILGEGGFPEGAMHKTLTSFMDAGEEIWKDKDSISLGDKFGNMEITEQDLELYRVYLNTLDLPDPKNTIVSAVKG